MWLAHYNNIWQCLCSHIVLLLTDDYCSIRHANKCCCMCRWLDAPRNSKQGCIFCRSMVVVTMIAVPAGNAGGHDKRFPHPKHFTSTTPCCPHRPLSGPPSTPPSLYFLFFTSTRSLFFTTRAVICSTYSSSLLNSARGRADTEEPWTHKP